MIGQTIFTPKINRFDIEIWSAVILRDDGNDFLRVDPDTINCVTHPNRIIDYTKTPFNGDWEVYIVPSSLAFNTFDECRKYIIKNLKQSINKLTSNN